MRPESPENLNNAESQDYRDALVEQLKQEKDREKRREILEEAKVTSKHQKAQETKIATRQEMFAEKDRQKELERDKEKAEYFKEVEILKFNVESKIADTNHLIDQFFVGFSGNVDDVVSPESLESFDEQIKVLDLDMINGRDYIVRASQKLLQLRKLESDIKSDIKTYESTKTEIAMHVDDIQLEIDTLKSQGFFRRMMAYSEISERQQKVKDSKKRSVNNDEVIKKDEITLEKIAERKYDLEKKILDLMIIEIHKTETSEIGNSLKELWDKISNSPFFTEEIEKIYIEQTIAPVFDKAIEYQKEIDTRDNYFGYGRRIDENLKKDFSAKMKMYLADKNKDTRESLRQIMSNFPSELSDVCHPLLEDSGHEPKDLILSSLFAQYAIEKVSTGTEHLKEERKKLQATEELGGWENWETRRQLMNDYYLSFPNNFNELPDDVNWSIKSFGHFNSNAIPNMPLWLATKDTPFIHQAFGDSIQSLDKRYFETILEQSLTDQQGRFIDNLYYYPNPDSIKTLVLIAAADYKSYRTGHANGTLGRLAQRADWQDLLDKAEEKYPELRQTRSVLETWEGRDQQRDAMANGCANDLAISLLKNESGNEPQSRLAEQVLPNDKLVSLLESGNKVKAEDAELLKQVNEFISSDVISNSNFKNLLRNSLLKLVRWNMREGSNMEDLLSYAKRMGDEELVTVLMISKKVLESKENPSALSFLTSSSVVDKIKSSINEKGEKGDELIDIDTFLSSHEDLPNMIGQTQILEVYCKFFEGKETIEFYKKLYELYGNEDEDFMAKIAQLVGNKSLTSERVIALARPIKTERGEINFLAMYQECRNIALSHADFLLATNDGLDLLDHLNKEDGIDNLDIGLEYAIGKKAFYDSPSNQRELGSRILNMELKNRILPMFMFADGNIPTLDKTNWKGLTLAYIGVMEDNYNVNNVLSGHIEQIKQIFETGDAKDKCLTEMKKLWLDYLKHGEIDDFPLSLSHINQFIKSFGGAGPLSQVESLSTFTGSYAMMLNKKHTAPRTKKEIADGLESAEKRFTKERWSNENISDFYNVSRDVMVAAPSLFSKYFDLFEKLKQKDFKEFSQEIFPLHRVILSLSEKREINGNTTFDKKDLVNMRKYIKDIVDESGQLKSVEIQKKELTGQILKMFKSKFGILKIPENLNQEHIRALSDISMYLANLSRRDAQKEDILSFYLALIINDKWEDYRRGVEINPEEYLNSEKAAHLKPYLENRAKLNPITPENLGIAVEQMPEFMKIIQEESENVVMGNVETVDVKLNNVITNLKQLEDLDLYPDAMDKKRMQLLLEYGNKKIGTISSKMYQSLKSGKQFDLSEEERAIKEEIETALTSNGFELTAENVKKSFQEEIKPLAIVVNILNFVEEIGVEKEISELRDILKPSDDVIAVFNKMGEEFKQTSGAIAISQDLEYLDNLIIKKAGELSEQEANLVKSYLLKVREKLATLEGIYDQVGKKFTNMKQGQVETKNELLKNKLEDISKIINTPESQQMIVSTMTNNLPHIIENIRECLSCVRQGSNNDTNLTFGDSNKFYLSSKSEMKAGSISDELIFFEPVTFPDGSKEMAFVLDRVWGTNTPTILINQIEVVYKKYSKIKKTFPDAKVSILVTSSAVQTGGISATLLIEKLREKTGGKAYIDEVLNAEVNVVESAAGDHYIEFGKHYIELGDSSRSAGMRAVSGVVLKL